MNYASSSGQKTASAQISQLPGGLVGLDITPPTSGYVHLTVYDSEDSNTAGKIILTEAYVDAGATGLNHNFYMPLAVNRGLYCDLSGTGTGSAYYIHFVVG